MVFDFDSDDFIMPFNNKDNMGMNMNGDFVMRLNKNFAMDLDSGDIHFTTPWEQKKSDKKDKK